MRRWRLVWLTVRFLVLRSVRGVLRGGPRSAPGHKVSGHERVLTPHDVLVGDNAGRPAATHRELTLAWRALISFTYGLYGSAPIQLPRPEQRS